MTKVKISKKARALRKKKVLTSAVVKAIIDGGEDLYSEKGIVMHVGNKTLTIKGSGVEEKK